MPAPYDENRPPGPAESPPSPAAGPAGSPARPGGRSGWVSSALRRPARL